MNPAALTDWAYDLLDQGREDEAVFALQEGLTRDPTQAALWQAAGICLRAAERLGLAVEAFEQAAKLAPDDGRIAQGLAQCRFEAGRDSVAHFKRALALAPSNMAIAQGLVAAVAAEQGPQAGLDTVQRLLARMPDWLAGHWLASRLSAVAGHDEPVDRTIAAEIRRRPQQPQLWQHRLFILMHSRHWEEALCIAQEARRRFPGQTVFAWNEAVAASETGDLQTAERLYLSLGPLPDIGNAIYRLRHWLRMGRPDLVAAFHNQLPGPAGFEGLFPYFAVAWRLLGDPKARWLEAEQMVAIYDLADELPPLEELGEVLRGLHNQVRQPLEQSVRGGTQTDGNLLLRDEPVVRALYDVLQRTVSRHIAALPASDPRHPQLRHRRDRPVRFAGSWSVRLLGGGHHEAHVHPEGWFSSALYVALPDDLDDQRRGGWLSLGSPQESLGVKLDEVRMVKPKPGRLVLFPSTMWHGTVPFDAGERLTVAFDVKMPSA